MPSWCHCHSLSLCFSKIQIGFTFLVPAHPVVLEKGQLNECVCVCAHHNTLLICQEFCSCWGRHNELALFSLFSHLAPDWPFLATVHGIITQVNRIRNNTDVGCLLMDLAISDGPKWNANDITDISKPITKHSTKQSLYRGKNWKNNWKLLLRKVSDRDRYVEVNNVWLWLI